VGGERPLRTEHEPWDFHWMESQWRKCVGADIFPLPKLRFHRSLQHNGYTDIVILTGGVSR
jgi:hypothetical protein